MGVSTLHDQNYLSSFLKTLSFYALAKGSSSNNKLVWIYESNHVTLNVHKNGVVDVLSTISSIQKMFSIHAQFQLKKQVKK
jgi:hypothetical protein